MLSHPRRARSPSSPQPPSAAGGTQRRGLSHLEEQFALLKDALSYDPETGVFVWRVISGKARPGARAGSSHNAGYTEIRYRGVRVLAHRLAWWWAHGSLPANEIDHINGVRTDNRIANLRDVPRSINNENLKQARKNNGSGLLGVTKHANANGYKAAIQVKGKRIHIGCFKSAQEAHDAYLCAKRRLHQGNTL